jgi:hypothetical protein
VPLAFDQFRALALEGAIGRDAFGAEAPGSGQELVEAEMQRALVDAWMGAQ